MEVFPSQVVQVLVVSITFFTLFFLVLRKILKDANNAALVTSITTLIIFFYMAVYNKAAPKLRDIQIFNIPIIDHTFVISTIVFCLIGLAIFLKIKKPKTGAVKLLLNTIALVLFLSTLYNIFLYEINNAKARAYEAVPKQMVAGTSKINTGDSPDVYYFVFDRYASSQTLDQIYDFDNSDFTDFLSEKGFVTNYNAHANYPFTAQSLASSLNMQYLDDIGSQLSDKSSNMVPLLTMVKNNRVGRIFKDAGYSYVQAGTWWNGSRTSDIADVEFNKAITLRALKKDFIVSEFSTLVLQESIFQPLLTKGISFFGKNIVKFNNVDVHRQYIEYQFSHIDEIASVKGPKFVFTHILLPHPPYIYDQDGSLPEYPGDLTTGPPESEKYINQLIYTNQKIKEMINTILEKSDSDPIIVLQADEGPYPLEFVKKGAFYDWTKASAQDLQQKLGILMSIREPGSRSTFKGSPVNLFPYIIRKYLHTDVPFLLDKYYVYRNSSNRYEFHEITNKLSE